MFKDEIDFVFSKVFAQNPDKDSQRQYINTCYTSCVKVASNYSSEFAKDLVSSNVVFKINSIKPQYIKESLPTIDYSDFISFASNFKILKPTYLKLMRLMLENNFHQDDLELIIRSEPGLAISLLRYANSPIYRSRTPATTLSDAISRLGYNMVFKIALSLRLIQNGTKGLYLGEHIVSNRSVYSSVLLTSLLSTKISHTHNVKFNHDLYFITSILYLVGFVYMCQNFPTYIQLAYSKSLFSELEFNDVLLKFFGFNHYEASTELLKNRMFPKELIQEVDKLFDDSSIESKIINTSLNLVKGCLLGLHGSFFINKNLQQYSIPNITDMDLSNCINEALIEAKSITASF